MSRLIHTVIVRIRELPLRSQGTTRYRLNKQDKVVKLMKELQVYSDNTWSNEIKEEWYDELSGGQKVKMELIRRVFLRDTCPHILLLDEVFSPLDPSSKLLVQNKLSSFCPASTILVIFHADATTQGYEILNQCGPTHSFFCGGQIHFDSGKVVLKSRPFQCVNVSQVI